MLEATLEARYDFISNVKGRTFPKGMSIEIVRVSYFKGLLTEINKSESFREHVTLYLYEHGKGSHYFFMNTELPEAAGIQLALDTREDLERTENIISSFSTAHVHYNLREIFDIWKKLKI
jgi:spore coat polysaccharide biosynthesis protein SpsF